MADEKILIETMEELLNSGEVSEQQLFRTTLKMFGELYKGQQAILEKLTKLDKIENRINTLEREVNNDIKEVRKEIDEKIEKVRHDIGDHIKDRENKFDSVDKKIDAVKKEIVQVSDTAHQAKRDIQEVKDRTPYYIIQKYPWLWKIILGLLGLLITGSGIEGIISIINVLKGALSL